MDLNPPKTQAIPASQSLQTYYDMLISQKKPFNLRKGSLVTADSIKRMELPQQLRCIVPSDYQVNPIRDKDLSEVRNTRTSGLTPNLVSIKA